MYQGSFLLDFVKNSKIFTLASPLTTFEITIFGLFGCYLKLAPAYNQTELYYACPKPWYTRITLYTAILG